MEDDLGNRIYEAMLDANSETGITVTNQWLVAFREAAKKRKVRLSFNTISIKRNNG